MFCGFFPNLIWKMSFLLSWQRYKASKGSPILYGYMQKNNNKKNPKNNNQKAHSVLKTFYLWHKVNSQKRKLALLALSLSKWLLHTLTWKEPSENIKAINGYQINSCLHSWISFFPVSISVCSASPWVVVGFHHVLYYGFKASNILISLHLSVWVS